MKEIVACPEGEGTKGSKVACEVSTKLLTINHSYGKRGKERQESTVWEKDKAELQLKHRHLNAHMAQGSFLNPGSAFFPYRTGQATPGGVTLSYLCISAWVYEALGLKERQLKPK